MGSPHVRGCGPGPGTPLLTSRPRLWSRLSTFSSSRPSFHSFTSSQEADDELSSLGSMSPSTIGSANGASALDRYHGEDTRPTSQKELAGWYVYAFAAETYVICGMSTSITPSHIYSIRNECVLL